MRLEEIEKSKIAVKISKDKRIKVIYWTDSDEEIIKKINELKKQPWNKNVTYKPQ